MNLQFSVSGISEALGVLLAPPTSVAELRVPNAGRQTLSGYFNDHSLLEARLIRGLPVLLSHFPTSPSLARGSRRWHETEATDA
jgi:hypothetical protein